MNFIFQVSQSIRPVERNSLVIVTTGKCSEDIEITWYCSEHIYTQHKQTYPIPNAMMELHMYIFVRAHASKCTA